MRSTDLFDHEGDLERTLCSSIWSQHDFRVSLLHHIPDQLLPRLVSRVTCTTIKWFCLFRLDLLYEVMIAYITHITVVEDAG